MLYVQSLQCADHGIDSAARKQVRGLAAHTQLLHKLPGSAMRLC